MCKSERGGRRLEEAGRTILCLDYVVEVCGWSWCGLRVRKERCVLRWIDDTDSRREGGFMDLAGECAPVNCQSCARGW